LIDGTRLHVPQLIEELLAEDADLVVHDCHALWGRVAADFLGLPRIVSNPLFPAPMPASGERVKQLFPEGWIEQARRAEASSRLLEREWAVDVGDWYAAMLSTGERTVTYTTPEIVGPACAERPVRYLGPLMDPRLEAVEMPPGPPQVYVAFGTFSNFRRDLYQVAIEALADEDVDVIVSTGRGMITPVELQPLPANIKAHEWVNSRQVLSTAGVHVTQAGGSSVHESLLAGVPMVCLPQDVDQNLWARRVCDLGVGEAPELDPVEVRAAVLRLLADDAPRSQAQAIGRRLAEYDGGAEVRRLIDEALAPPTGRATGRAAKTG
jgi:MGT family glycosyltransferase